MRTTGASRGARDERGDRVVLFRDLERDSGRIKSGAVKQAPAYLQRLMGLCPTFSRLADVRHCEHCHLGARSGRETSSTSCTSSSGTSSTRASRLVCGSHHGMHLYQPASRSLEARVDVREHDRRRADAIDLVNDLLAAYIVREKGLASTDALYTRLAGRRPLDRAAVLAPTRAALPVRLGHLGIARSEIAEHAAASRRVG